MESNYAGGDSADWVREAEIVDLDDVDDTSEDTEDERSPRTRICNACKGFGLVEVDGYETDCVECEGWGDFEI